MRKGRSTRRRRGEEEEEEQDPQKDRGPPGQARSQEVRQGRVCLHQRRNLEVGHGPSPLTAKGVAQGDGRGGIADQEVVARVGEGHAMLEQPQGLHEGPTLLGHQEEEEGDGVVGVLEEGLPPRLPGHPAPEVVEGPAALEPRPHMRRGDA